MYRKITKEEFKDFYERMKFQEDYDAIMKSAQKIYGDNFYSIITEVEYSYGKYRISMIYAFDEREWPLIPDFLNKAWNTPILNGKTNFELYKEQKEALFTRNPPKNEHDAKKLVNQTIKYIVRYSLPNQHEENLQAKTYFKNATPDDFSLYRKED